MLRVRDMKITKIDGIGNQYIYGNCENINDVIPKTYKYNE